MRRSDRAERRFDVDAAVPRGVGAEPPRGLHELALAPWPPPTPGLVPRDSDVNEPLQEIALRRRRLPPLVLELLVRGEELPRGDQLEASFESHVVMITEQARAEAIRRCERKGGDEAKEVVALLEQRATAVTAP